MDVRNTLAAVSFLALATLAPAVEAAGRYAVSAQLSHQGEVFASPSAVVSEGEPATIEVAGADGYRLVLTVKEVDADRIEVAASLDSARGSMTPNVVVEPGATARVQAGDVGLALVVRRSNG